MPGLIVSTDRLIPSSEARKRFGQLLDDVNSNESAYYVILEIGLVILEILQKPLKKLIILTQKNCQNY